MCLEEDRERRGQSPVWYRNLQVLVIVDVHHPTVHLLCCQEEMQCRQGRIFTPRMLKLIQNGREKAYSPGLPRSLRIVEETLAMLHIATHLRD